MLQRKMRTNFCWNGFWCLSLSNLLTYKLKFSKLLHRKSWVFCPLISDIENKDSLIAASKIILKLSESWFVKANLTIIWQNLLATNSQVTLLCYLFERRKSFVLLQVEPHTAGKLLSLKQPWHKVYKKVIFIMVTTW